MKAFLRIMLAALLVLLCSFSFSQTTNTQSTSPQNAPSPAKPASAAPAQTSAPSQTPTAPAEAKTAAQRHGAPQAKTKEELAAYQAAESQADLNAALAAADQFSQQYPQSELRYLIYAQLMQKF